VRVRVAQVGGIKELRLGAAVLKGVPLDRRKLRNIIEAQAEYITTLQRWTYNQQVVTQSVGEE
jgi:hypothetical protein